MLQIIHAIFKNPEDKTKVSLIYANVTHDDILLKHELDELSAKHSDRFTVQYVLNTPPEGWTGGVGFVSQAQIAEHMPPSSADIKVLMCGTCAELCSSTSACVLKACQPLQDLLP